jgi:hypothetical protein
MVRRLRRLWPASLLPAGVFVCPQWLWPVRIKLLSLQHGRLCSLLDLFHR